MHAVATCACANVLSEQKSAMASVTLNHTIEQAMSVENEVSPHDCARRTCRKRSQPSLRSAGRPAVNVFVSDAWPLGPCALFNRRGIQCNRWTLCFP